MLRTTTLHSGWEFIQSAQEGQKVGFSQAEWLPATVPGHVHLDLVANGVIADPYVRMNELGCQWVDEADWSYRTAFEWEADEDLPRRVLRFEGLDTVAFVFLNGEPVGQSDNMFVPLEIDVTDKLVEGTNELRIDFKSAVRVGLERRAEYVAKENLPEDQPLLDDRSFVRKAQYMFGWDWGPRLVSCGVWRPVTLLEFTSRILDVHVTTTHRDGDLVIVDIKTEIDGEGTPVHCLDSIGCRIGDGTFVLKDPERWEPSNPALLRLTTGLIDAETDQAPFQIDLDQMDEEEDRSALGYAQASVLQAVALDSRELRIGIRQVRLVREPDEWGESFEFEINGRPIWARGANWIPDSNFPAIVTRERYREQLERCVDMGFNTIRVWGGGLYEADDFYELCDELGILVWQDFPFACAYYPDDLDFQRVVADEAYVNVKRLRNHPSLALWCGNNENHEMHFNRWAGDRTPDRYYGLPIYESVLPELLSKADPATSYIPSSPIGTPPEGKVVNEKRRGPNSDGYGDQHNWDVWHGRGDWRYYEDAKGRFSSEYGFASSPSLECWRSAGVDADEDYHGATARWHDKTGKGHDTFVGYVKLHYPEPVTLEDWIYYSQLNQRDALRLGVESNRRSEFCRGSLIWQMNDCWPVQSWAFVDSLGNYKALAYELRRLHGDAMLSIARQNDTVRVWACNDGDEPAGGPITLRAIDLRTGEILREFEGEADLDFDERTVVMEESIAGLPVPDTLLVATWADLDETWQLVGEPKAARLAPPGPLTVSTAGDGYLQIRTDTPLVDLMLLDEGSPKNLLDNFVTVPEPGVFAVRVERTPKRLTARSLAGVHPVRVTRSPL